MLKSKLSMKFSFLKSTKKTARKTISDYKQEYLVRQGREQFKKLMEKGLGVPIAFL